MSSILKRCEDKGLLNQHPKWMKDNIIWEVITGSIAYGINTDSSDWDIYSVTIPPKNNIFPHLAGHIIGFGRQPEIFNVWQQHHINDVEKNREYDITCYNIVKYFDLCINCNPNMIDSLYVPRRCVLFSTAIGEHMRENRRLFLSKKAWNGFRGYAFAQMSKIKNKSNSTNPKRAELINKFGFDTKFASHAVRLLLQIEEIFLTGDLNLDKNASLLKDIRNGTWTLEKLESWITEKEKALEITCANSKIPDVPDEEKVKQILLNCLEMHYGDLSSAVSKENQFANLAADLNILMKRYNI